MDLQRNDENNASAIEFKALNKPNRDKRLQRD